MYKNTRGEIGIPMKYQVRFKYAETNYCRRVDKCVHSIIVQIPALLTDFTGKFLHRFNHVSLLACIWIPEGTGIFKVWTDACEVKCEQCSSICPAIELPIQHTN